ncbi:helix-hairpin-helix domain-containing protein, partial [Boseongicola aestuarii]
SDETRENRYIAQKLNEVADLLQHQDANTFRVQAYRDAASYITRMDTPLRDISAADGRAGLEDLPSIGPSIAGAIQELLETGALTIIDRLRGAIDPEKLFQSVPMIGPHLAHIIHEELGLETLEDLEVAAHDGRLAGLKGLGPRRIAGIRMALAEILARRRPRPVADTFAVPTVEQILDVDKEYRAKAEAGKLPAIQPRRFNPQGDAWLPILHTERGSWHFTALYSNTSRAHRLGRTTDWVVVYFELDGQGEGQCTVVTEHHGPLSGLRVVRGREDACMRHYEVNAAASARRG